MHAPLLHSGTAIAGPRGQRGAFLIKGDDHQIEVGRVARQAIGESAAVPPAAFSLTANHDFAQIMLAGVVQYGFLFGRVGERGGFRP